MAKLKEESFRLGLLPHKKEVKLILLSQVVEDYDRLREIIEEHGTIPEKVFRQLPIDDQEFLKANVLSILRQARSEWFIVVDDEDGFEDLGEDWETIETPKFCDLCKAKLRYKHCVENKLSSKRIIIGGICKEDFKTKDGKSADEIEEEQREVFRTTELERKFPGIRDVVRNCGQVFDGLKLMIPERLKNPYYRAVEDLINEFSRYASGRIDQTSNVAPVWEEFCKARQAMINYSEKYKSNWWKATRRIEKDLYASSSDREIGLLNDNDCAITPLTLYRIEELSFLRTLVPVWNSHFSDIGIEIKRVSQDSPAYVYRYEGESDLDFIVSHKVLSYNFGNVLFESKPLEELTARNIVIRSSPYRTPQSLRRVLVAIRDNAPVLGLEVEGVYEDTDTVIFFNTGDKTYLEVGTHDLVQKVGPIALFREDGLALLREYMLGSQVQKLTQEQLQRKKDAGWAFQEEQRRHRRGR